ncbi:uncharacterized protein SAPINGB_P005043 [Magnusiomyces paraingens]|uniref:Uncharacterized protein n=1 Tax=Magnusiomyces paraingens TaxID=2606893 RepID=A0A5E8C3P2_9ASCO|nr:uncharacterized protein SAPINGB_P005043 [Saprochaete ingens]VVT56408.1 unnamed protein product [Saprochaete ingens]
MPPTIHLYFTQFAAPDAVSSTTSKDQVRSLVVLEKRASRALQHHALGQVLGIPIDTVQIEPRASAADSSEYETHQQSALSRKPWHRGVQFNTTNEGGTVVVAVTDDLTVPLGVDLVAEHHDNKEKGCSAESTDFDGLDQEYVKAMVLTENEIKTIKRVGQRLARQRVYAAAIALKEAFLKYHGIGLVGVSSLADVEVTFPKNFDGNLWVSNTKNETTMPTLEWVGSSKGTNEPTTTTTTTTITTTIASALKVDYTGDRATEDSGAAGHVFRVTPVRGTTELVGAIVGPLRVLDGPEQNPGVAEVLSYKQHHVSFSHLL